MAEMLTTVAIIFIIAGPFLLLANRFNLTVAPLLILSGVLTGTFIDRGLALELTQFGIALLVFSFGVGIQLSDIDTVLADSELAAIGQIIVIGSLGTGFGVMFGLPPGEALILGVAAALSSTIVATALLETEVRSNLVQVRIGQSIQLVQDLFAVVFILIISAGVLEIDPIVLQIGYGTLFLIAAVLVNRYLFDLMLRLAGDSEELLIVGVISLLVLFMGAAEAVDIPVVVGAFAAGLAVRYEPSRHLGLFNGLESIKDFFVAIFFVTVGAQLVIPFVEIGPVASVEKLALAGGLVVLAIVVKPVVTTAILISRGYEARTATLTGFSNDQVSEFALIIAIQALLVGALSRDVFDAIILAAAITMITSTISQRYDEELYQLIAQSGLIAGRHTKIDELSDVPRDITDHVIVLGYGRTARQIVEKLESEEEPYVVIENDPSVHERVSSDCQAYVFGDGIESYAWEKANVENARAIVSTTEAKAVSHRLLAFDFDAPLLLRAPTEREAIELLDAGATYVAVSDLLASEELVTLVKRVLDEEMTVERLRTLGIEGLEHDDPVRTRASP